MSKSPATGNGGGAFRQLFVFIGVILILFGQYYLSAAPTVGDPLPPQTIFLSLAGMGVTVLGFLIRPGKGVQAFLTHVALPSQALWILSSVVLIIMTVFGQRLYTTASIGNFIPVLSTWFASGALFVFSFRGKLPQGEQVRAWWMEHRRELLVLGGITLLAAILRLYKLGDYPRVMDGDEGRIGMNALSTISGTYANPFTLWENFGALYLQAVYLSIRLFGVNAFALRILPAISGILAIPALYLFVRQVIGKRVAVLSAFLLAVSHTHINFSRIGSVGYIHSTWLVPLELYLLVTGLVKKKPWMTAASGVLLAIHFSVYLTSQIIVALVLVYMLVLSLLLWNWFRTRLRQAGAFWGGFFLMIMPELNYILQNPNAFFDRLAQNGTFQTGWLAQTMANTGQPMIQVLGGRVVHAFLALIFYPARDFYGSSMPMLTIFAGVLFLVGLVIALVRFRDPAMLILNGYFWAPTLAVGIFSIPPSADSYRMLIALPPAMVLAALAIDELLELFGLGWQRARRTYAFLVSGLILSLAVLNLWTYYGDFVGQCRFGGDLAGRFASYLGTYAGSVEPGSKIYLLSDSIYFYGSHDSAIFLSERRTVTNLPEPIAGWTGSSGATLISSPARIPELEAWIQANPGGEQRHVYDCSNLILLSYQIP